ncbi:MAG: amino acid synthesis family protein [Acidimicrobiales bacterium]|nr:amino acid synthesis family protein [Acidimicrobiales bacterium]
MSSSPLQLDIRKVVSTVETTRTEIGRPVDGLRRKVATGIVMRNPYAGAYVEDLEPLVELGAALGQTLIEEAIAVLGCPVEEVQGYGKAAVVGTDGEIEHAAALIHPKFGAPIRAALGRGPAIIPSTKLLGGPGTRIVAPITNCSDIWVFDDMDAIASSIDDAPRPDEILVVLALSVGGRPLHRIGK